MNLFEIKENIIIAFQSMRSNKLRSALAALGVVIGISFVILMGWVLSGLDRAMTQTFETIGTDMLHVDKWDWAGGKNWRDIMNRKDITLQQANEFQDRMENAELSYINYRMWADNIKYKNNNYEGISIIGTEAVQAQTPSAETIEGRFFNGLEDREGADVVVIGYNVYKSIFGGTGNPSGSIVRLRGKKLLVIGVVKKQGTTFLDFLDNQCFIPLKTYLSIYGRTGSASISIKAGDYNMDDVRDEAIGNMRIVRNLKPWQEEDFSINEMKAFESSVKTLRMYVWGIGIGLTVLSFIVGIIGIMNIMFVSVTERTKEIGIRKAIGAKKSSIITQFLAEASALSFIGALVSFVGCSLFVLAIALILPKIIPQTSFLSPILPFELLLIASLVSIFVGVLAGLIPAYRAANLDPVDALRYE